MADVSVARAQREEMLPLAAERPAKAAARSFPVLPCSLMILWAGMVLVTGGFLLTGTMRIGAGNWIGRRMPVHEIWSRFLLDRSRCVRPADSLRDRRCHHVAARRRTRLLAGARTPRHSAGVGG